MATKLDHATDARQPAANLWRWFWLLVFAVVVLTLIAVAVIAERDAGEHVVAGPDWPQCCDHWKTKRVPASKHLIY
jgi:heme A synthase